MTGKTITLKEAEALDKQNRLQQVQGYNWGKDKSIVWCPELLRFFRILN